MHEVMKLPWGKLLVQVVKGGVLLHSQKEKRRF